jgi:Pyrrolidone-carboxylate peptidase (N-terminal pyroglutamyl peptidase)
MKILLAGFKGDSNSARVLLEKISPERTVKKLYLDNDFSICKEQLEQALKIENYDYIIAFGQKPVIKAIYLETIGRGLNQEYETNYEYSVLKDYLKSNGYRVKISSNAGNFLCNYIYFCGLDYIAKNRLATQIIFVHIPYLKNIDDIGHMGRVFNQYFNVL